MEFNGVNLKKANALDLINFYEVGGLSVTKTSYKELKEIIQDSIIIGNYKVALNSIVLGICWNNQFSVGFSVDLNERINISLYRFLGIPVNYWDMSYDGIWCYTAISSNNHDNFDLSVTAKYILNKIN